MLHLVVVLVNQVHSLQLELQAVKYISIIYYHFKSNKIHILSYNIIKLKV